MIACPKMQLLTADVTGENEQVVSHEEKLLQENPGLKDLFNHMLDKWIKQAAKEGETSQSQILTSMTPKARKPDL